MVALVPSQSDRTLVLLKPAQPPQLLILYTLQFSPFYLRDNFYNKYTSFSDNEDFYLQVKAVQVCAGMFSLDELL